MISFKNTHKSITALALSAGLLLTGCSQQAGADTADQAASVQVSDAWAKAAESGMSAAFAVLENPSGSDIALESVTDKSHGAAMEIHEMAGDGAEMSMRPMAEPLVIPAGASVQLAPGGHHIMYMGLTEPLVAAETSTLTLNFTDGSSRDVDFAVRNYDGANESYHADADGGRHGEGGH